MSDANANQKSRCFSDFADQQRRQKLNTRCQALLDLAGGP
jgi:hypothetical protein